MARCPFATWRPISGSSGPHLGGPYKIVHHTTEGSSAAGALAAFAKNRSDPHFTVDGKSIYQHIDTAEAAKALRNDPGGVQTNRDSAVQIELVGFAHLPKDPAALTNLARLCRWIEATHGVPAVWPAGLPKPAVNGKDPGGHNRNAQIWDTQGGHYGHCHVPENTHWDPAYSAAEADFILAAQFDAQGKLLTPMLPAAPVAAGAKGMPVGARGVGSKAAPPRSTMPDHGHVEPPVAPAKPTKPTQSTQSTKKAAAGGPLTVAQARALVAAAQAPQAVVAKVAGEAGPEPVRTRGAATPGLRAARAAIAAASVPPLTPATQASVQAERQRLAMAQRAQMRQRLREYNATLDLLEQRGTKGLHDPAAAPALRAGLKRARAAGARAAPDSGPLRVLAEGDSWFDYPGIFGGGVISRLEDLLGVPILSLAQAGDESRLMLGVSERKVLAQLLQEGGRGGRPWDLLLFSGGGNDIVDNPLALWLADYEAGKPTAQLLRAERYANALALVRAAYEDLIALRDSLSPGTQLVFHGYDFPIPNGKGVCKIGPWLRPAFDLHGFPPDMVASRAVVQLMLEQFAAMLGNLAKKPGVSVVPTQGVLAPELASWHNEMHPSRAGFDQICGVFHAHLKRLFPGRVLV